MNPMAEHSGNGFLFAVKRARDERRFEHFCRTGRVLDDGAIRREIPAQNGNRSMGANGFIVGVNDVLPCDADFCAISVAFVKETVAFEVVQIFAKRLSGDGHGVQMEHGADFFHDSGHAAGIVKILRRPLPGRADVEQVMRVSMESIEHLGVELNPKLMGNRGNVQQRIG